MSQKMKPIVHFADFRCSDAENLQQKFARLLKTAGLGKIDLADKFVAIKLHFGEAGNMSYLRPNWVKTLVDFVRERGGRPFLTDANTLYVGQRKHALDHIDIAYENGFSPFSTGCHIIIADGLKGTDDVAVPLPDGKYVKEAYIGRALVDADVIISLTHFKCHEMTGIGGALHRHGRRVAGRQEGHALERPSPGGAVQLHRMRQVHERVRSWRMHRREERKRPPRRLHRPREVRRMRPLHRRVQPRCHRYRLWRAVHGDAWKDRRIHGGGRARQARVPHLVRMRRLAALRLPPDE